MSTLATFIDMKKSFDWDLLLFKILSQFDSKGKVYNVIASLYNNSKVCVKINNYKTSIFDITPGVKQGDAFSPTLPSMFINDLAADVKNLNCGVDAGGMHVSIHQYAEAMVLIAPNKNCVQK